jgi:hypothetical protein
MISAMSAVNIAASIDLSNLIWDIRVIGEFARLASRGITLHRVLP